MASTKKKRVFYTKAVSPRAETLTKNKLKMKIDPSAMHSLDGEDHRIVWYLKIEADVRFWPDVDEQFELELLPAHVGEKAGS